MFPKLNDHYVISYNAAAANGCDVIAATVDAVAAALLRHDNPEGQKFHPLAVELRAKARSYRGERQDQSHPEATHG